MKSQIEYRLNITTSIPGAATGYWEICVIIDGKQIISVFNDGEIYEWIDKIKDWLLL